MDTAGLGSQQGNLFRVSGRARVVVSSKRGGPLRGRFRGGPGVFPEAFQQGRIRQGVSEASLAPQPHRFIRVGGEDFIQAALAGVQVPGHQVQDSRLREQLGPGGALRVGCVEWQGKASVESRCRFVESMAVGESFRQPFPGFPPGPGKWITFGNGAQETIG